MYLVKQIHNFWSKNIRATKRNWQFHNYTEISALLSLNFIEQVDRKSVKITELKDIINQLNLTDIYRMLYFTGAWNTFFSSTHGKFDK